MRTSKASGITPWKILTRYCAGPAYYRMCSTDVYCSKQTGSSSTKGNHHPSFLRFWNWAEENCHLAAKICGGAENVVKTETQQTFLKWIARFYYFRHLYSAGSACVLLTIIAWVAHRYGQLYLLLINNFWVRFSCFCIVISLSLRVK